MIAPEVVQYDGKRRCVVCGHKAVWSVWYSTSYVHYCDKHLPSGAKHKGGE